MDRIRRLKMKSTAKIHQCLANKTIKKEKHEKKELKKKRQKFPITQVDQVKLGSKKDILMAFCEKGYNS